MLGTLKEAARASLRQPYLALSRRWGRVVRPLFLDYALTWRCNARCVMCDTWQTCRDPQSPPPGELTLAEIEAIFSRDHEFLAALRKIGLTGGEPFLRRDLVEIVRLLNEHFPAARISLVSNGLMTGRILEALEQIRSFMPQMVFSVSLDGRGETHDQVRGVPGAFNKAMATIKGAKQLGFPVTSGLTLSGLNYDQIEPVARLLAELEVDFSCNLMEEGLNFHTAGKLPQLDEGQRQRVLQDLAPYGYHYYMDHVRRQLKGQPRTLPCYAGHSSYFLTPEGQVTLCNLLGEPLGDLRTTPWAQIAVSPAARQARRQAQDCTCWSQCEVKNSAASAPWHLAKWWLASPQKMSFLKRYLGKNARRPY